MSHLDIIRAWKDEEYRLSLSEADRTPLPDHPAGLIELTDADLRAVAGGNRLIIGHAVSLIPLNYHLDAKSLDDKGSAD